MTITRRDLLFDGMKTICAVELMRVCIATRAFAASIAPNIDRWRIELEAIARDFRSNSLPLTQWHAAIEELNGRVPMEDLLKLVAFEAVQPRLLALGEGEHFEKLYLPSISEVGRPFSSAIFSVSAGTQIPPHGHNNQVTAHMLVRGQLHTCTYERLHDVKGAITIKPKRDELLGPGTTVTMSSERENVHWFTAQNEPAFSFQISASTPRSLSSHHVNQEERGGRVYLDLRGKPESDGTIVAPVIDAMESHRIYSI
jgi:hypothetical protein